MIGVSAMLNWFFSRIPLFILNYLALFYTLFIFTGVKFNNLSLICNTQCSSTSALLNALHPFSPSPSPSINPQFILIIEGLLWFASLSLVLFFHFSFPHVHLRGTSFHMLICHLCIFFVEMSFQISCPFFSVKFFVIVEF